MSAVTSTQREATIKDKKHSAWRIARNPRGRIATTTTAKMFALVRRLGRQAVVEWGW